MSHRTILTQPQLLELQLEIEPLTHGFNWVDDHVVVTDADGNILYANEGAAHHTGFSKEEMMGKNPGDLWGGRMEPKFYEDMWHTLKVLKVPFRGEVKNRNKDGTEYWQELRVFPIFDEHDDVRFMIGIEPDVTVRKVGEELQDQYVKELERLNKYLHEKKLTISELAKELPRLHF